MCSLEMRAPFLVQKFRSRPRLAPLHSVACVSALPGPPPLKSMSSPQLSLVVPIYNEARLIPSTVQALLDVMNSMQMEFEIVVVDDGSSDDSAALLDAQAKVHPPLRVLTNPINEGKGSALRKGVLAARGSWIVTLDADLSTDLEALPRALAKLEAGTPVVIGDRRHPQSSIPRRQSRFRERCGGLFNALARLCISRQISDYTCGFKAYQRHAALDTFEALETTRWAYDVELLACAQYRDFQVASLPVTWRHDSDTRVRLPADAIAALFDLLRITLRFHTSGFER
jgi:dolichyl-phosphate beta-glucosyltransferase